MGLHKDYDDAQSFPDFDYEDEQDHDKLSHKKRVRQMLEERLERKRLKAELDDELEGEFDWSELDRE